jgi:uncharacterized protein with beta-barrel porin domain
VVVSAGIDVRVNKRLKLGVSYDGQMAVHATDAGFRGKVSWQF